MTYIPIFPLLNLGMILIAAGVVLGTLQNDRVSRSFLVVLLTLGGFTFCELLMLLPRFEGDTRMLFQWSAPFWSMMGLSFLLFIHRLTRRPLNAVFFVCLFYSAVVALLGGFTDELIYDAVLMPHGGNDTRNDLAFTIATSGISAIGLYGIILLAQSRHAEENNNQRRILTLMLIGSAVTLSGFFVFNIFIPSILGLEEFPRYGTSTAIAFVVTAWIAVHEHRFLTVSLEQLTEELFENYPDAVMLVNRLGEIRRWNHAARRLLHHKMSPRKPMLKNWLADLDPFSAKEGQLFPIIGDETSRTVAVRSFNAVPFLSDATVMLILSDETDRIRAQTILRHSRDALEKEVLSRTRRIQHTQRLNALSTIASRITHDFNGLLNTILGFATAAREELPESSPVREDMAEVIHASERARDLIRMMISFSDRSQLPMTTLELYSLMLDALRLAQISASRHVDLRIAACREPQWVRGNLSRLHQAIMNLVVNALHAMEEKGGTLSAQVHDRNADAPIACVNTVLPPGIYIELSIADEGLGIPEAMLPRIFEPFFTTRRHGAGTGLGLATVLQVMEEHGGGIQVDSEVNSGSVFRMIFARQAAPKRSTPAPPSPIDTVKGRILVVDDQESVARVLCRFLQPVGYSVDTFENPLAALEAIRQEPDRFDAILSDYSMPHLNGVEFCRLVHNEYPEIPLFLMSGKYVPDNTEDLAAAGILAFLPKPIDRDRLLHALQGDSQGRSRSPR